MNKNFRLILLLFLIIAPIIFYKTLNKNANVKSSVAAFNKEKLPLSRPRIALVFDDLGDSLAELKDVYSLGIPLTISVIPSLKFSKNIAHIGARCGFSVFIHLPLQPTKKDYYMTGKYRFISSDLPKREVLSLLRQYLNSIRIAIGVNNHMGSSATQDPKLMRIILDEIKKRGLAFVDSRTSNETVAYKIAFKKDMICGYNEGFLDFSDDPKQMEIRLISLIEKAKEKGKIIVIAHPRPSTLNFLKRKIPNIRKKIEFITLKDYFEL